MPQHLRLEGGVLRVGPLALGLGAIRRIVVVGAGKAGAGMVRAVEAALGDDVLAAKRVEGIVNVPADCVGPTRAVTLVAARPAGVNEPTPAGVAATRRILDLVAGLGEDDLALVLLSGGGSALLTAPPPGFDLADKALLTRELSARGASIEDLNAVRRELSVVKGGGLARACRAGRLGALILSDVIGDDLATIASGPTVPCAPDVARATRLLEEFGLAATPAGARALKAMRAARHEGGGNAPLATNVVIGSNATAVEAAARAAAARGYEVVQDHEPDGTAEETAARLADRLLALSGRRACLISGGEPTVRLAPAAQRGLGGRNQQLALAALLHLGDCRGVALLSGGTDGEDGPTDAAGAVACEAVAREAAARELDVRGALRRNDAYRLFEAAGGLIRTGPTHTNVCDLRVGIVDAVSPKP